MCGESCNSVLDGCKTESCGRGVSLDSNGGVGDTVSNEGCLRFCDCTSYAEETREEAVWV